MQDYSVAQFKLGFMYYTGAFGIAKDYPAAALWLRKAADQGNPDAFRALGGLYAGGHGVARDPVEAFVCYELAIKASRGPMFAGAERPSDAVVAELTPEQLHAARIRVAAWRAVPTQGQRMAEAWDALSAERYKEALPTLQTLSGLGHRQARFVLAGMYLQGMGVTSDLGDAARLYELASEQGHPMAQTMLGLMYLNGKGVTADKTKAAQWLAKGAEGNISLAQYHLAFIRLTGNGVAQDLATAASLLRRSAEQGKGDAMYALGQLTIAGKGVARDPVDGYKWLVLAQDWGRGSELQENLPQALKDAAKKLSKAQIAEAEKRAAAWVPVFPGPSAQ